VHDPAKKRASRRKGAAEERALVRFLQQRGFAAEKSSRAGYRGPDLTVPLLGIERVVEVKCRANGFRELYTWLADRDILIVRARSPRPPKASLARTSKANARSHLPMTGS
jgi:hypothetical protein